jgi:hypothetical protein
MKILSEKQIHIGFHVLAALTDDSIEDLKTEFEEIVTSMGGKNSKAVDTNDEARNLEIKCIALERLFKTYRKPRQWIKFVNRAKEEAKETEEVEEILEEEVEQE